MSFIGKREQYYGNNPVAYQNSKKVWTIYTHFGKDDSRYTTYYDNFLEHQYKVYYWELIHFIRSISEIYPNDYRFAGMYYERKTNSMEHMYTMTVHDDDSLSFDYYNVCVDFQTIRVKVSDIFKIFDKKGDALKFLQYCMKCFSTAALLE